jgi:hypothetical protein
MANDRIYLTCKTCGERKMLVKYYPSLSGSLGTNLEEWLYEHLHHGNFGMFLDGDPGFTLITESDPTFTHQATDELTKDHH